MSPWKIWPIFTATLLAATYRAFCGLMCGICKSLPYLALSPFSRFICLKNSVLDILNVLAFKFAIVLFICNNIRIAFFSASDLSFISDLPFRSFVYFSNFTIFLNFVYLVRNLRIFSRYWKNSKFFLVIYIGVFSFRLKKISRIFLKNSSLFRI